MRFVAVVVGLFFLLSAAAWGVPVGDPSGGGAISGDTIIVGIIAPGQDGGSGNVSAGDPNGPAPYRYVWLPPTTGGLAPIDPICDAGFGTPGQPYTLVVQDLAATS